MHAGAAEWEERGEVVRELSEEFSESGTLKKEAESAKK